MVLRLDEARTIVDGAIARARELEVEISVAVCDRDGRLIALNIMDRAVTMANQGSIGKALASAVWGRPSGDPQGILDDLRATLAIGVGVPAIAIRGGLPVVCNGVVEGACGVAGSNDMDRDEDCARAGIAALVNGSRK
jgi:glc operon protein GlcG